MSTVIGTQAPTFSLPDTDGVEHGPGDAPATLVVFTCNHCPYALAWHDRILGVARDYPDVKVLAVSSNDGKRYPDDAYEKMRERVEADGGWPIPYLYDDDQDVARAFGAEITPHCFVLDGEGRLVYQGAPDADYEDPTQNGAWLRDALDAVLAGSDPVNAETAPVGCSIKWKDA